MTFKSHFQPKLFYETNNAELNRLRTPCRNYGWDLNLKHQAKESVKMVFFQSPTKTGLCGKNDFQNVTNDCIMTYVHKEPKLRVYGKLQFWGM